MIIILMPYRHMARNHRPLTSCCLATMSEVASGFYRHPHLNQFLGFVFLNNTQNSLIPDLDTMMPHSKRR